MARTMIDHACEGCGSIRKVSPCKLAKGIQRFCRKCQGKQYADQRRAAMIMRGGPKRVHYSICNVCRRIYAEDASESTGYCDQACQAKASGGSFHGSMLTATRLNRLWSAPRRQE